MKFNNMILIGLPGSGKSTLGVLLAKRLCMSFIDTDLLIQTNCGKSLQEIIEEDGINRFLEMENDVMLNLNCSNTIIATGGSAVLSPDGLNHLKTDGTTVYLEISYADMTDRIGNGKTRGIVMKPDEEWIDMFEKRIPLYEKYADIKVNCSERAPRECVEKIMGYFNLTIDRLLSGSEEWLQYAIRLNLLDEKKSDLVDLKFKALGNDKIKSYLQDVADFHNVLVSSHKNPELPLHKLLFLLDIGLDCTIPEIQTAVDGIMKHKTDNGVYQSFINIPKHFGGSGEDTFGWCLCDAPLLLLTLLKAGVNYEKHIKKGVDFLVSFYKDNGFPCTASSELGKFRGPGRKDDCCPYATLIMLKLLLQVPEYRNTQLTKHIADSLLSLWESSREQHPYMFYMGTDFRKLKAPAIWYDIVSVADVLSGCDSIIADKRFLEMISIIQSKQDQNGFFTPESIYQKCKDWDFGQKKAPSSYLTYLCIRILKRVEGTITIGYKK